MRIKNYISYSQYQAFNSGQYEKIYLRGIKLNNKGLKLGKIFAEAMESDEIRDDEIALIKLELPTPKHREKEFRVDWEGIPILGSLDGFDEEPLTIHEYKTGKTAWNQSKVDKAEQLTFYALFIWLTYKKLPEKIYLYWIKTDDNGLTGEIKVFETQRSMKDFIKLYPKLKKAWIGIEEIINNYLNL